MESPVCPSDLSLTDINDAGQPKSIAGEIFSPVSTSCGTESRPTSSNFYNSMKTFTADSIDQSEEISLFPVSQSSIGDSDLSASASVSKKDFINCEESEGSFNKEVHKGNVEIITNNPVETVIEPLSTDLKAEIDSKPSSLGDSPSTPEVDFSNASPTSSSTDTQTPETSTGQSTVEPQASNTVSFEQKAKIPEPPVESNVQAGIDATYFAKSFTKKREGNDEIFKKLGDYNANTFAKSSPPPSVFDPAVLSTPTLSSFGTYPLYIGDLDKNVTEALIFSIFSKCGPIASVKICRDATTKMSLGYGYVNFQNKEGAETALREMNYTKILDVECRIMPSAPHPKEVKFPEGANIYLYNLHSSISARGLYEKFSEYGKIISLKMVRNPHTGKSMCRAYIQYATKEEADKAIKHQHDRYFGGSRIGVHNFLSKEERKGYYTSKKTPEGILNIRGIAPTANEISLRELFDTFGTIHSVYFTLDTPPKETRLSLGKTIEKNPGTGWGYVNYYDSISAKITKSALHDVYYFGSRLLVDISNSKIFESKSEKRKLEEASLEKTKPNEEQSKGDEATKALDEYPIVIRTFDKKIDMSQIESIIKQLVPDLELPSSLFKVYKRPAGTTLQCTSILARSKEEGDKIVEAINNNFDQWSSLVACVAGSNAFKSRNRRKLDDDSTKENVLGDANKMLSKRGELSEKDNALKDSTRSLNINSQATKPLSLDNQNSTTSDYTGSYSLPDAESISYYYGWPLETAKAYLQYQKQYQQYQKQFSLYSNQANQHEDSTKSGANQTQSNSRTQRNNAVAKNSSSGFNRDYGSGDRRDFGKGNNFQNNNDQKRQQKYQRGNDDDNRSFSNSRTAFNNNNNNNNKSGSRPSLRKSDQKSFEKPDVKRNQPFNNSSKQNQNSRNVNSGYMKKSDNSQVFKTKKGKVYDNPNLTQLGPRPGVSNKQQAESFGNTGSDADKKKKKNKNTANVVTGKESLRMSRYFNN